MHTDLLQLPKELILLDALSSSCTFPSQNPTDYYTDTRGSSAPSGDYRASRFRSGHISGCQTADNRASSAFDSCSPEKPSAPAKVRLEPKQTRPVYFVDRGFQDVPIYERESLARGVKLEGPCLIEEIISTTVLPPDWALEVDPRGNFLLRYQR